MAENVRARYRGRVVGAVSGWALGWGVAVLMFVAVSAALPAQWVWRILFAFGILPAFFVLFIPPPRPRTPHQP